LQGIAAAKTASSSSKLLHFMTRNEQFPYKFNFFENNGAENVELYYNDSIKFSGKGDVL